MVQSIESCLPQMQKFKDGYGVRPSTHYSVLAFDCPGVGLLFVLDRSVRLLWNLQPRKTDEVLADGIALTSTCLTRFMSR
jgi:hypothetical protein